MQTAYLAAEKFLPDLLKELKNVEKIHGNLVLAKGPVQKALFAQCVWENAEIIPIASIGEAVKALRSRGPRWALYSVDNHRRAQLIQEQLPKLKNAPLEFLGPVPETNLGAWTLLDKNTLLASAQTNSPLPLGAVEFHENKTMPPSRAYLKLWELMTVYKVKPEAGQKVIDFGSCPGGWTWVLQQCGCHVLSIDRAPLDEKIAKLPRIEFKKTNAFNLKPEDLGKVDWFFSDIICYPPKLFELVKNWMDSGLCSNFVCTIKFQGETDFATVERFEKELGAKVIHLHNNKHEVTAIIQR